MSTHRDRKGLTRPALLIVIVLAAVLAVLCLRGLCPQKHPMADRHSRHEIDRMMLALMEYFNEFSDYPPGGTDLNDDGDLDDPGEDFGSGKLPADPKDPTPAELQLRAICTKLPVEGGKRTVGPFHSLRRVRIINGAMTDIWGNPFRYLADGRRTSVGLAGKTRLPGRIRERGPVIWSVGFDGKQDPGNNNLDDDGNGKVDDRGEMKDDICSWH